MCGIRIDINVHLWNNGSIHVFKRAFDSKHGANVTMICLCNAEMCIAFRWFLSVRRISLHTCSKSWNIAYNVGLCISIHANLTWISII